MDGAEVAAADYDAQDRIQDHGAFEFEQTAHGDLVRRVDGTNSLELTYDALGTLQTVVVGNAGKSTNIDYTVDGAGRRVGKQVGGKFSRAWLYRDALRPVAEITSTGVFTHFVYTGPGAPSFMLRAGVPFRIIKDQIGSVRLVVNATTGAIAQRLDYDEFGRVLADTSPGFQPFGFAGGFYDPDTKLVHFGARDYDSEIGRWVTKDPSGLSGGVNLYVYCANDPVNCTDPTGNAPDGPYGDRFGYWMAHADYPGSWVFQTGEGDRELKATADNLMVSSGVLLVAAGGWTVLAEGAAVGAISTEATAAVAGAGAAAAPELENEALALEQEVAPIEEGAVSVFHGSINNGAQILQNGLDPSRGSTFVSRDIAAAQDAIVNHFDAARGVGTIIESRIPLSQFQAILEPLERSGYKGFFPYSLDTTEIILRDAQHFALFNQYIVR